MDFVRLKLLVITLALSVLLSKPCIEFLHGTLSVRGVQLDDTEVEKGNWDAVIVLGYALFRNGSATNPLKERVNAGVDAWQKGFAANLVFSGAHPSMISGYDLALMPNVDVDIYPTPAPVPSSMYITGGGNRKDSEASVMAAHGLRRLQMREPPGVGVHQPGSWYLEAKSTSTYENALYSLQIAKEKGWSRIMIATNTFHQRRSLLIFQKVAQHLSMPCQVRVLEVPIAGHSGWGGGWLLDHAMDLADFVRELAAMVYNAHLLV